MAITDTAGTKSAADLKQKLRMHFEEAKQRIEDAEEQIAQLREEDEASLRAAADEVRDRLEQQRNRAEDLRRELQSWLEDKKEHTTEAIASWKQKREIRHLEKRADRAEEHAVNAVLLAMIDADEAELAVIDAIEARLDADAVTR
ncbi:MAG: hypothetical protein SFX73_22950 [Kofleriaceae bacterium]|nr:hypothetical protein [Kofleriaceae bacterium]